jgi:hypothetical protein
MPIHSKSLPDDLESVLMTLSNNLSDSSTSTHNSYMYLKESLVKLRSDRTDVLE